MEATSENILKRAREVFDIEIAGVTKVRDELGDAFVEGVRQCLKILHDSGYDGYYSLEFEGIEETVSAIEISMENLNRMLGGIGG